jgi:hypothetical protein
MNFNLKDIVCIDLTKYTNDQLLAIEEQYGYFDLVLSKKEGYLKMFWEVTPTVDNMVKYSVVAYMISDNSFSNYKGFAPTKSYAGNISKHQRKHMMNMDPFDFKFEIISESLDLDDILDKISEHGIKWLTPNEKKYLDKVSKEI